jgi:competence protein ComEC
VELELVANRRDRLRAEVLVAPHHGSRTSSSEAFVRAVAPGFVVFAVGHQNRFGFPKHDVVARYLGIGAAVLDTADDGAILLRVENGRDLQPSCHRALKPRYWN